MKRKIIALLALALAALTLFSSCQRITDIVHPETDDDTDTDTDTDTDDDNDDDDDDDLESFDFSKYNPTKFDKDQRDDKYGYFRVDLERKGEPNPASGISEYTSTLAKMNLKTGKCSFVCPDPVCPHNDPSCPFYDIVSGFVVYDGAVFYRSDNGAREPLTHKMIEKQKLCIYDLEKNTYKCVGESFDGYSINIYYEKPVVSVYSEDEETLLFDYEDYYIDKNGKMTQIDMSKFPFPKRICYKLIHGRNNAVMLLWRPEGSEADETIKFSQDALRIVVYNYGTGKMTTVMTKEFMNFELYSNGDGKFLIDGNKLLFISCPDSLTVEGTYCLNIDTKELKKVSDTTIYEIPEGFEF